MELYSYQGKEPAELPFRIRLDDGSTRTSLNILSVEELQEIGFIGPIVKPQFDQDTQKIEWTGTEYQIILLTDEEIANKNQEDRLQNLKKVNYNLFWQLLIDGRVYKKLRNASLQSLAANTICTELISLFSDAKVGKVDEYSIQKYLNILFLNFEFTSEEVKELKDFMNQTYLDVIFTLPDEEYISTYTYHLESNTIIPPAPYESWTLVNDKWEAPIPYPTDGKTYRWIEEELNWEFMY